MRFVNTISSGRHLLLAVLLAVAPAAGCGFAHMEVAQPFANRQQYDGVAIGKIELESHEKNKDALALNDRFRALARQLLEEELRGRYTLVEGSPASRPGTLVVDVHVFVQYGNRGKRYAGFGGAGAVDSRLTAIDAATGEIQLQAHALSDLAVGLFGGDMKATIKENLRTLMSDAGL